MTEAAIIALIEQFLGALPSDVVSAQSVIAAWKTNDQATLDTLRAQSLAAANAEAPAGSTPLT